MDLGKVQNFSNARTMRSLLSTDVMDQYNVSRMALMKLIAQVLIANGANGVLAAKPVETDTKSGKLKFQPNLEEDALEIQEETVMSDHALL